MDGFPSEAPGEAKAEPGVAGPPFAAPQMRIAIAQIDPVVGAFEANVQRIAAAYERACSMQARLLLTTELSICGYPPHDLVERPEMFERNEKALEQLRALTQGQRC